MIGVGITVMATPSEVGNYKIADKYLAVEWQWIATLL